MLDPLLYRWGVTCCYQVCALDHAMGGTAAARLLKSPAMVMMTSKRRRFDVNVVLTSYWRYYCVMCPLGLIWLHIRLYTYPMQLSGSLSQSILQRNLCQVSQPMGGVSARPLSSDSTGTARYTTNRRYDNIMGSQLKGKTNYHRQNSTDRLMHVPCMLVTCTIFSTAGSRMHAWMTTSLN